MHCSSKNTSFAPTSVCSHVGYEWSVSNQSPDIWNRLSVGHVIRRELRKLHRIQTCRCLLLKITWGWFTLSKLLWITYAFIKIENEGFWKARFSHPRETMHETAPKRLIFYINDKRTPKFAKNKFYPLPEGPRDVEKYFLSFKLSIKLTQRHVWSILLNTVLCRFFWHKKVLAQWYLVHHCQWALYTVYLE